MSLRPSSLNLRSEAYHTFAASASSHTREQRSGKNTLPASPTTACYGAALIAHSSNSNIIQQIKRKPSLNQKEARLPSIDPCCSSCRAEGLAVNPLGVRSHFTERVQDPSFPVSSQESSRTGTRTLHPKRAKSRPSRSPYPDPQIRPCKGRHKSSQSSQVSHAWWKSHVELTCSSSLSSAARCGAAQRSPRRPCKEGHADKAMQTRPCKQGPWV
jgi:hypothetical protein